MLLNRLALAEAILRKVFYDDLTADEISYLESLRSATPEQGGAVR